MSSSEEESEYEVEKILDKKGSGPTLKYQIKWKRYPKPTWEPASNCDCIEMITAFERKHAKSSKQKSDAESDSADDTGTTEIPASSSGSSKKRRVVQSPKRRDPPSPQQPQSNKRKLNDSSESEYEVGKKHRQSSSVQRSSRTSRRTNTDTTAGTSGTPKTTFNRSRTSIRTPATPSGNRSKKATMASPSSASSSEQSTLPRKRTRTNAPVKKSPSKNPRKSLPQSSRSFTPLSQCDNLNFNIERIESLADLNGRKGLMIKTTEGRTKTVDIKAAAKQNCDMVLNFLIEHVS
jgi:hypothetical protein